MRRIFNMFLGFIVGLVGASIMILSIYGSGIKNSRREYKEIRGTATKAKVSIKGN